MHDSNEKASASLIFPLRLSIAVPPKECVELHGMYDPAVAKYRNISPIFFFFF